MSPPRDTCIFFFGYSIYKMYQIIKESLKVGSILLSVKLLKIFNV